MQIRNPMALILVGMSGLMSGCGGETFTVHTSTGTHVRTTVKDSGSCETVSATDKDFKNIVQRVKCKKSDLVTRSFQSGWMSTRLQVCPGLRVAAVDQAPGSAPAFATYRVELTGAESFLSNVEFDHSLAKAFEVKKVKSGQSYCQVEGSFDSPEVIQVNGKHARLAQPAESMFCQISN